MCQCESLWVWAPPQLLDKQGSGPFQTLPSPWTQAVGSQVSQALPSASALANPSTAQAPWALQSHVCVPASWFLKSPLIGWASSSHRRVLACGTPSGQVSTNSVAGIHWIPTDGAGGVGARLRVGPEPPSLSPWEEGEKQQCHPHTGFPPRDRSERVSGECTPSEDPPSVALRIWGSALA